jgi:hypothetical protein
MFNNSSLFGTSLSLIKTAPKIRAYGTSKVREKMDLCKKYLVLKSI